MNNLHHRSRGNSIHTFFFSHKMSNEFHIDQTTCVNLRLNSFLGRERKGRGSLNIVAMLVYSRKTIMIQLVFFFFLYWFQKSNKLKLQKSMQRNNYSTHSNSFNTANKARFILFISPLLITIQLEKDYKIITVFLFHDQMLKALWLNKYDWILLLLWLWSHFTNLFTYLIYIFHIKCFESP